MWVVLLLAAVASANPQYTKTGNYGVKGGYSGQGHNYQYTAGDNLVKYFGNNTQQGYAGRPSYPAYEEPGVGVCFIEVPTATLVRDPTQVPAGNGSRPDLSRVRSCCKGYIRNIHNYRLCDPVCTEECVNALCTAPETCTCFPDHVKNAAGFCIPTCPIGCQNGQCAGGECICKNGYRLDVDSKFCLPSCQENCGGSGVGNCTAPNTCTCKPGYESTASGSCKPTCSDCRNGDCVAPNQCRCKQGYAKDQTGVCVPHCVQDCGVNGRCIAPNVCNNPTTTTSTPSHYLPHQPYNPSYNQHNPQPNPLSSNHQNHYNSSNNPYEPGNQRPYYSNYPNQPNYPNGQTNNPNQPRPNYQDQYMPYYPNDNRQPYNITSDSQVKPYNPNQHYNYPYNPINQTLNYPNGPNGPINETNPYGSYQPYNPSNPNQRPIYSQYNPNVQSGHYPSPVHSNHSNPNQAYYPTDQQSNYPYPYDQTSNEQLVPRCSQPCINGVCVEGNRCACNPGYELDSSDPSGTRCRPHCPGGCQNGVCSAPNFCICNMGYRKEHGVKGGSPRCVKRMKRAIADPESVPVSLASSSE